MLHGLAGTLQFQSLHEINVSESKPRKCLVLLAFVPEIVCFEELSESMRWEFPFAGLDSSSAVVFFGVLEGRSSFFESCGCLEILIVKALLRAWSSL